MSENIETSAGKAASWWPVMTDKRLDDIGKALVVADGPTIAHELYDEVQRLRTLEESYSAEVRRLRDRAEKAEFELAGATEANAMLRDGGKKLRAELDKCAELNRSLVNEAADATVRAEAADRALAELRATLRPEYGLRYPSNMTDEPDEQLGSASDEETARLLAARGDTIMRRLRTDWEEVAGDAG